MAAGDTDMAARDRGFTLVEIVVSIVLVAIVSAVAVVGISRLTGNAAAASCDASADAARAATTSYFVANMRYPADFTALTSSPGGSVPMLEAPAGTTVSAQAITASTWTLAMTPGAPPTFTCTTTASAGGSGAPATTQAPPTTTQAPTTTEAPASTATTQPTATTAAPTTSALPHSNGVTASSGVSGDRTWYIDNHLMLTNTQPITNLVVTISIERTPGVSDAGWHTNFWAGRVTATHSIVGNSIVYTFNIVPGTTIVPGTWRLDATANGSGTLHPSAGDMWSITSTSGGVTDTLMGTF